MLIDMIHSLTEKELKEKLMQMHEHDLKIQLEVLDDDDKNYILSLLDDEKLSQVLTYLDAEDAAEIIENYSPERQVEILESMEIDDAVDILSEMEEEVQETILSEIEDQASYEALLKYEDDQAGSYITDNYVDASLGEFAGDVTKRLILLAPEVESINHIFVVDENKKYIGLIPLIKLVKAEKEQVIDGLVIDYPSHSDTEDIALVLRDMRYYGAKEAPIVDINHHLVGMITMDDLLHAYHEEAEEDFEKLAALPDTSEKNVFKQSIKRLPWLIILVVLSLPIAYITSFFEEILASVIILAMFQPLILDAAGDVASQTLAVTLIEMNKKDGAPLKNGYKEILSGVISGFVMAIAAFIATMIFANILKAEHAVLIAIVVSISIWITVIIGPIVGLFVPITLKKINKDPAVASGPFITTLVDILSLVIYFSLALLILGGAL